MGVHVGPEGLCLGPARGLGDRALGDPEVLRERRHARALGVFEVPDLEGLVEDLGLARREEGGAPPGDAPRDLDEGLPLPELLDELRELRLVLEAERPLDGPVAAPRVRDEAVRGGERLAGPAVGAVDDAEEAPLVAGHRAHADDRRRLADAVEDVLDGAFRGLRDLHEALHAPVPRDLPVHDADLRPLRGHAGDPAARDVRPQGPFEHRQTEQVRDIWKAHTYNTYSDAPHLCGEGGGARLKAPLLIAGRTRWRRWCTSR